MNAYHIIALVPFVIDALMMRENMEEIIRYNIAANSCQFPACPSLIPGYDAIYVGLIPLVVGVLILFFTHSKRRQRIDVNSE
jgi:hypothetical protein